MADFATAFTLGANLLSGELGAGYESSLVIIGIYFLHLLISAGVIYLSLKAIGGGKGFLNDFPKALFTVFIRDLLLIPLLFLIVFIPIFGIIIALVVWLGIIKYIFAISWIQAILAWIISVILWLVIVFFVLLPIAVFLIPGLL